MTPKENRRAGLRDTAAEIRLLLKRLYRTGAASWDSSPAEEAIYRLLEDRIPQDATFPDVEDDSSDATA